MSGPRDLTPPTTGREHEKDTASAALPRFVGVPFRTSTSDAFENRAGDRTLRILLAEDNLVHQRVTRLRVEKVGHSVDVVSDGGQAVEPVMACAYDVLATRPLSLEPTATVRSGISVSTLTR